MYLNSRLKTWGWSLDQKKPPIFEIGNKTCTISNFLKWVVSSKYVHAVLYGKRLWLKLPDEKKNFQHSTMKKFSNWKMR